MKEKIFLAATNIGHSKFMHLLEVFIGAKNDYEIVDWKKQRVYPYGVSILERLDKNTNVSNFGIFFIHPDDFVKCNQKEAFYFNSTNIIFELGYFFGKFSSYNSLILFPNTLDYKKALPEYLIGLNPLIYDVEKINDVNYCNKLFAEISENIKVRKKEYADKKTFHIYDNRTKCYEKGIKMIQNANHTIYSIISFKDELAKEGKLEKRMKKAIIDKAKERGVKIYRYMNLGNNAIKKQAITLIKETSENIIVMDTYCKFVEAIITGDEVLIVLPAFKDKNKALVQVEFGIYIKNIKVAKELKEWCNKLVPEPKQREINSIKDLGNYMINSKRNEGNRKTKCEACDV